MNNAIIGTAWRRGRYALVASLVAGLPLRVASGQIAVDELELKLSLKRGTIPSEVFHAANGSPLPAQATISIQDWDRSEAGENRYYPLGSLKTSCASHIKVFPSVLQLGPRTTQTVRVTLDGADSLPHGCYAILFVETPAPPRGAHGPALVYSVRYGVKVYVEPDGPLSAEVENVSVERAPAAVKADSSSKQLVVCFRNTSSRQTQTRGKVEIRRTDNTLVTTLDIPEFPTLPGATRRLGVRLPRLVRGRYVVLALLDYEGAEIAAGQVDLDIP